MRYRIKWLVLGVLAPLVAYAAPNSSGLTDEQKKAVQAGMLQNCIDGARKDAYFIVESQIQKIDVAPIYCDCLASGSAQLIKKEDMDYLNHHKQMSPRMQIAFTKHANDCKTHMKAEVKAKKLQQR